MGRPPSPSARELEELDSLKHDAATTAGHHLVSHRLLERVVERRVAGCGAEHGIEQILLRDDRVRQRFEVRCDPGIDLDDGAVAGKFGFDIHDRVDGRERLADSIADGVAHGLFFRNLGACVEPKTVEDIEVVRDRNHRTQRETKLRGQRSVTIAGAWIEDLEVTSIEPVAGKNRGAVADDLVDATAVRQADVTGPRVVVVARLGVDGRVFAEELAARIRRAKIVVVASVGIEAEVVAGRLRVTVVQMRSNRSFTHAERLGARGVAGREVTDFVSLTDLAPTFLSAAGAEIPEVMTGRSLLPVFQSEKDGRVQLERDHVVFGRERHTDCQEEGPTGYPSRALRTDDYLYIRNYRPERWPAGTPHRDKAYKPNAWLGDCDNGPTKFYLWANRDFNDTHHRYYDLSFGKRPAEELYVSAEVRDQVRNVVDDPALAEIKQKLAVQLTEYLRRTGDPRETDAETEFDDYQYIGGVPKWPGEAAIKQYEQ